jgi:pimeloyl-ACP methyl ester carboxylesterase
MPLFETSQGLLFYAQRGTKEPALVCLHGAGGTHQYWGLQLRSLSDCARVITLDLPGHGRSALSGQSSILAYSHTLVSALDALGLTRVILAGHSMGGAIALQTALEAPTRVAGLALVGTAARLRVAPAFLEGMINDPAATVEQLFTYFYGDATPPECREVGKDIFRQADPQVFHDDLKACDVFDIRERLGEITCPTLIVCGDEDQMTPLKFSHSLQSGIVGSELVVVPGSGHMVLLEQPDTVNAALRIFMNRVSAVAQ